MTFSPLPAFLYRQQKLRTHSWLEQFRAVGISKRVVDISTSAGVGYYSGVRNMPKKKAHEGPDGRVTRTQEHAGPSAAAQRTIFEAPSTMLVSTNTAGQIFLRIQLQTLVIKCLIDAYA